MKSNRKQNSIAGTAFSKKATGAAIIFSSSLGICGATTIFQLDLERTLTESSGGTSAITQTGWTSVAENNGGSNSTLTTPSGITVTAGGGGIFQGRAGGTWGTVDVTDADWGDVVGDTVAARNGNGTVTIALTGLAAIEHTLTAWHNVSATDSASFSGGFYTITPSLSVGTAGGTLTAGQASNINKDAVGVLASDFSNSVISFTPDGSGNATITLTSASTNNFLTLSGIEVTAIPEPSTGIFALVGLALGLRRRR